MTEELILSPLQIEMTMDNAKTYVRGKELIGKRARRKALSERSYRAAITRSKHDMSSDPLMVGR